MQSCLLLDRHVLDSLCDAARALVDFSHVLGHVHRGTLGQFGEKRCLQYLALSMTHSFVVLELSHLGRDKPRGSQQQSDVSLGPWQDTR